MKRSRNRIVLSGGLSCLLLGCGALYWRGGQEEEILTRQWAAAAATAAEPGEGPALSHPSAVELRVAEALHPPAVKRWTAQEMETFLRDWTGKVRAEEERLIAAGTEPFAKLAAYKSALAAMTPEELLTVCYGIPPDTLVTGGGMNWKSSDEEIRSLLLCEAFQAMKNRFPFLSLQLPLNRLEARPFSEAYSTIRRCAEVDRGAAWEVVKAKFGGAAAPADILYPLLEGAVKDDPARRLELAREWGILDKVANFWPAEASATPAGQDAWIAALRETAPGDRDERVRNFTKEVETSEGFDGVKRLLGRVAEKGTPLYDTLLREAAGRDLEEDAAPKADWILAETTPAAAVGTAETLITQWTAADPLSASEWLDKVPKSAPWRQAAVRAFAKAIEPHDPEAAALWRKAGE